MCLVVSYNLNWADIHVTYSKIMQGVVTPYDDIDVD